MNTKKLVLAGLLIFVALELMKAAPAAKVGYTVAKDAGTIVSPPEQAWSGLSATQKTGFAMGSAWADLGTQDDIRTCAQAESGERYSSSPDVQAFMGAGALYNKILDGVFGLDC